MKLAKIFQNENPEAAHVRAAMENFHVAEKKLDTMYERRAEFDARRDSINAEVSGLIAARTAAVTAGAPLSKLDELSLQVSVARQRLVDLEEMAKALPSPDAQARVVERAADAMQQRRAMYWKTELAARRAALEAELWALHLLAHPHAKFDGTPLREMFAEPDAGEVSKAMAALQRDAGL